MKKILTAVLAAGVLAAGLSGCSSAGSNGEFKASSAITVVTREEGSGTRDAFVELTGVLEKDASGNKTDNTTVEAGVIDATQAVMSTVAGDDYAIGYISLGSLNDSVKALKINGAEATAENVKSGDYSLFRPFNIAVKKSGASEAARDFIAFIMSDEGQAVVAEAGYIQIENAKSYSGKKASGKVTIGGSSSVSPLMEKLKEAYGALNTGVKIEIQTTDSSSGMSAVTEGTCDVGMASRELKDDEPDSLTATKIALDGIAVIVNKNNTANDLKTEQIKSIYTGEATEWDMI